jgi:hypothetical protein
LRFGFLFFYISRKDLKRGKAEPLGSAFAAVLMVVSLTPSVQLNHITFLSACQVLMRVLLVLFLRDLIAVFLRFDGVARQEVLSNNSEVIRL